MSVDDEKGECVGLGNGDGCGYIGGKPFEACPKCDGILLSHTSMEEGRAIFDKWAEEKGVSS